MTRGRRVCGAWAVLALLLAGCTSTPEPGPKPFPAGTTSPTVSATPTATGPAAPVLPPAAMTADQAGAEAFFRYFWEVYSWSYLANDADLLESISTAECSACMETVADVRDGAARGLVTVGGRVTVPVVVAAFGEPTKGLLLVSTIDQEPATQTDPKGVEVSSSPERRAFRVDAKAVWSESQWRMSDLTPGREG